MHWKLKALIQRAIAHLPSSVSYEAYYWAQRRFGGLRRANPTRRLLAGIETWKRIRRQGHSPAEKVFLEVGTGRAPLVPVAYWLMGAESTISIDVNPYLREDLVVEHLRYISAHDEEMFGLFGSFVERTRFDDLLRLARRDRPTAAELLDLCQVNYIAPGDAANTGLPEQHVDFHTSFTVFEHIPPGVLVDILREGNRILKNNGLSVHRIDYSDHFSHSDRRISAINFLQYADEEWKKYAGNRYMYMSRLRHDDYLALFESVGQRVVAVEPDTDQRSEELLKTEEFRVDSRFSSKPREVLAISGAWIVTESDGR